MTTPIKTKFHHVLDLVQEGKYSLTQRTEESFDHIRKVRSWIEPEALRSLLDLTKIAPKFYIDDELYASLPADDIEASLGAMVQAGVPILPYPQQLIEFDDEGKTRTGARVRNLVLLMGSSNAEYPYVAFVTRLIHGGSVKDMVFFSACRIFMAIKISDGTEEDGKGGKAAAGTPFVSCQVTPTTLLDDVAAPQAEMKALARRDFHLDAEVSTIALGIAAVLLNTRGIKKERIDTQRINRKRASSGKALVPEHTVIRIGHVYGRDGQAVGVSSGGGRKPTRVHWRRAHIRGIRYGKGREKVRYELIHAVLVNYQDGDEVPVPRARVAL